MRISPVTEHDRKQHEDVRYRLLKLLENNPDMSQRDLAKAVGIGLGSVNYCVKALVDRGLIKLGNFSSTRNKRGYAYILTPKGMSEKTFLAGRFLQRKKIEYETIKAEIRSLQTELAQGDSESWGRV
ncbi:MarR family EPS-associated transcriptional regulator [Parasphingorhabdus sp.]|uniref:MarR family EPS-associated transcriptional regulator n=1 Tax=Parasphingorhabdus sp. TaxID=2709688 RepID=UPI003A920705